MSAELFADRLRELREQAGMSRKDLAAKAGFRSEAGIRDLEQGVRKPTWETVLALAKALEVECTAFTVPASADLPPAKAGRPKKSEPEGEQAPARPRGRPRKGSGDAVAGEGEGSAAGGAAPAPKKGKGPGGTGG